MTYLGTPLVDAGRGLEAIGSILAVLEDERRVLRSRVLALQWMHEEGPAASIIEAAVRAAHLDLFVLESFDCGLLRRRAEPTYEELQSTGDRKRRRRRRLAEQFGHEPQLVVRTPDATAVDEYITLEAAGYKGRTGAAMAAVPGEIDYFRDVPAVRRRGPAPRARASGRRPDPGHEGPIPRGRWALRRQDELRRTIRTLQPRG